VLLTARTTACSRQRVSKLTGETQAGCGYQLSEYEPESHRVPPRKKWDGQIGKRRFPVTRAIPQHKDPATQRFRNTGKRAFAPPANYKLPMDHRQLGLCLVEKELMRTRLPIARISGDAFDTQYDKAALLDVDITIQETTTRLSKLPPKTTWGHQRAQDHAGLRGKECNKWNGIAAISNCDNPARGIVRQFVARILPPVEMTKRAANVG
jgi:hypothetical protein